MHRHRRWQRRTGLAARRLSRAQVQRENFQLVGRFATYGETNFTSLSNVIVTAVAAGYQDSLVLKSDGTVAAFVSTFTAKRACRQA